MATLATTALDISTTARFYTDFADGAILFPLGAVVPLVLGISGQRRAALAWTIAISCVWAVTLMLKLTGYTINATSPASVFSVIDLVTPSGHVASSAAIYGGLVGLLLSGPGTLLRRSVLAAVAVAVVIGTTRVLLGAHSLAEVLVGTTIGVAGAAGLALAAGKALERRARVPVLAAIALLVVTFHGDHSTWERPIQGAAYRIIEVWNALS